MEPFNNRSIKDMAKALQVAISTVSSVLNGKGEARRISKKTQQRILSYARVCGYQPNQVARSLRTGESRIIGMLVEDMANPFFAEIAQKIEKVLFKEQYKLICSSTENELSKGLSLLKAYQERRVDGYIIAPMPGLESAVTKLIDYGSPVVLFDSYISTARTSGVVIDNFEGTYDATKHLLANGYKNIAFISVEGSLPHLEDRMAGYAAAMEERQLPVRTVKVSHGSGSDVKQQEISDFIIRHPEIDAAIFASNYLTISGLQAICDLRTKIPDQLAVISFDDSPYFKLLAPSITAIAQPLASFALEITGKLLNHLKNPQAEKKEVVLNASLIVRGSSAPACLDKPLAGGW